MATPSKRPVHVLNVAPLNSVPYIDPKGSNNSNPTDQGVQNGPAVPTTQPSLLYISYEPTNEEVEKMLSITCNGVVLNGSAAKGLIGPAVGKLDIGEDETSYIFRVSLPGVARGERTYDFSCDVGPDGRILIKGVTTTGERAMYKDSMKFVMVTQNLSPPGPFSISFKLPGPVDSQTLDAVMGIDGVFEGIVKKKRPAN